MPINKRIPGQLLEVEMLAIEAVAELVPRGGVVVEVGSLLGKSSWIWAKSAGESVRVFCIDPWEVGQGGNFQAVATAEGQHFTKNQFLQNVNDCPNIVALQGFSPADFSGWSEEIDCYFEDAVHTNPILGENLRFWSKRLRKGGILCGHDYTERFPDVVSEAKRYAVRFGRKLRVIGTFWFLLPEELKGSSDPNVRSALKRLEALEEKDAEFSRMRERIFSLGDLSYEMTLSSVPSRIDRGKELVIQGSVTNKSGSDWPVCVRSEKILRVGAELYSGAEKTRCAAARYCIESQEFRHDDCVHFELRLPTEKAATGRCEFVVDLVYEGVVWFRDRGGEPVRGSLDIVPTA